ncbi:MAG TPA: hypothetical protein VE646_02335 [Actinomycetota bacterium]|jgi:hypothetical protein|nr:hypothetical protein [Actinomycetota bacterium]
MEHDTGAAQAHVLHDLNPQVTISTPSGVKVVRNVPTGNDTAASQAYYDYLLGRRMTDIPPTRTGIQWQGPIIIYSWFLALTVFFFLFARFFSIAHRKRNELYGVTRFGGGILERNGRVTWFTWGVIAALTALGIWYVVFQSVHGQWY